MARINRMLGSFDLPLLQEYDFTIPAAAATHVMYMQPDLSKIVGYKSLPASALKNGLKVRAMHIIIEGANYTGVVTNNVTIALKQYRAGAAVATLASVTVDNTVTLSQLQPYTVDAGAAAQDWRPGDVLVVSVVANGTGGAAIGQARVIAEMEELQPGTGK